MYVKRGARTRWEVANGSRIRTNEYLSIMIGRIAVHVVLGAVLCTVTSTLRLSGVDD